MVHRSVSIDKQTATNARVSEHIFNHLSFGREKGVEAVELSEKQNFAMLLVRMSAMFVVLRTIKECPKA